jgi:hypothetical protein
VHLALCNVCDLCDTCDMCEMCEMCVMCDMCVTCVTCVQESRIMTEAGAIYNALGRHTGAAGFRSPQQTLPNIPVRVGCSCSAPSNDDAA